MDFQLWHGCCLEEMKKIKDNSIDMVLADPPYGTTACKWDTVIPFEPMWKELKRITKDNGAICLFGSEPFSSHLRLSNLKMFKYDWVWLKNFGSGFSSAKKAPLKYHEIISCFYAKAPTYNPQFIEYSENSKRRIVNPPAKPKIGKNNIQSISYKAPDWNPERGSYPKQIIKFNCPPNSKGRFHPTQKPVALLEYLIKTYTLESETVLDFTMGSGSTGVACKNLNRKFIGIEKEEKYFKIAKKRILT
jgi:site-specific DNA-methyltransferase (adenine-specific)